MTIKQILLATLLTIAPLLSFAVDFYIATSDLNVRTGAGTEFSVSFTLQKGDEVEVLSKNGSWYKIKYLGQTGYAHSKYLKDSSTISDESDKEAYGILVVLGVIGFFWLLPILIIISSRKTTGSEKIAWILAVIFISWFAWIFYLLLAPIKKK